MCKGKKLFDIVAIVLLVALLFINIFQLARPSALEIEELKAGGKDNWNNIVKIYKNEDYIAGQTDAIDSTLAQFAIQNTEDNNDTNTQNQNVSEVVENLLATAPVRGDKNARFTIIEYTELRCPYCQRHSVNGTINAVMEEFPGEVNSISRHYIIHGQEALELAAAIECVADLKADAYYDVFEKAFEAYPVTMDQLVEIAVNQGVKKADLQSCIDDGTHLQDVEDMMNVGATIFGISGTPGNVIYDRETGKYQVLPGAYPAENFVEIINSLKAE